MSDSTFAELPDEMKEIIIRDLDFLSRAQFMLTSKENYALTQPIYREEATYYLLMIHLLTFLGYFFVAGEFSPDPVPLQRINPDALKVVRQYYPHIYIQRGSNLYLDLYKVDAIPLIFPFINIIIMRSTMRLDQPTRDPFNVNYLPRGVELYPPGTEERYQIVELNAEKQGRYFRPRDILQTISAVLIIPGNAIFNRPQDGLYVVQFTLEGELILQLSVAEST